MRKISSREMKRIMQKMGMNLSELNNVEEVIIIRKEETLRVITPTVSIIKIGDQTIFQITGEKILMEERKREDEDIPEGDIQLVAMQAGVSFEEAKKALKQVGGDLAKAILMLTAMKNKK
ncbi:MAG: nascent polypeptide-associated complex protein [Nitrososphaeria archaeon]